MQRQHRALYSSAVGALVTGASMLLVATASMAQPLPSEARDSVVRRGAPEITMPSDGASASPDGPLRETRFQEARLRGAIGQVPEGDGQCMISEGRFMTTVTYQNGLPIRISKLDSGVRDETQQLRWNAERVLLERVSWTLNILQPATRRTPERWEAQNWSVETTTWDDYGRPLTRNFTQASGQVSRYECSWLGFRGGSCVFTGPLEATVKLSPRGEVEEVEWKQPGGDSTRGHVEARWDGDRLMEVRAVRGPSVEREQFRYNTQGELTGIRRSSVLPRGERVVTWALHRDEARNVTRVERRCEGPCEGMRGTSTSRIRYDEGLENTFCGAWWDDGVEPRLRGW